MCPNVGHKESELDDWICTAGMFCSDSGNGLDVWADLDTHACSVGKYCPAGTTSELSCPAGTYNPVVGRSSLDDCLDADAGYYVSTTGASAVTGPCAEGYYCPSGSSSATQLPCPVGRYRSIEYGAEPSDCAICKSGHYCSTTGLADPVICPLGSYCPIGTIVPEPCPEGTYGAATGLTDSNSCTFCDAGYFCDEKGMVAADLTTD